MAFDAKFVAAAAQVLDERVTRDNHSRGAVGLQASHRPQPCFQTAVVALDPVVRVLERVVQRVRQQVLDHVRQRRGLVGDDLFWFTVTRDRSAEELARRGNIATGRDVDVDDLAVSVDSAIHVAPHTSDLDVGLVHEPASPDGMSARSRRVYQPRCELMRPGSRRDLVVM